MQNRSSGKVLLLIIGVLLASNLFLLYLYVSAPKGNWHSEKYSREDSGLTPMLREKVGFNPEQIAAYQEIRNQQREANKSNFSDMMQKKERFFSTVFQKDTPDSTIQKMADSIEIIQRKVDIGMRDYFSRIRGLCTPDQEPRFDSSIRKVIFRMVGGMPGGRQNPPQKK